MSADPDPLLNTGQPVPLYIRLIGFADVGSRDTGQGYPYRARLASSMSCSTKTIDRATAVLEREIGLVTVTHRKVEGKPDENDANQYTLHDGWLIHGVPAPPDTPPQLVARYGHTVPGLDVNAWLSEHAPGFDRSAWQAAYDARLREQEEKEAEQRRKDRARRKPKKAVTTGQEELSLQGGGDTGVPTPEGNAPPRGSDMYDATGGVTHVGMGSDTSDTLLSKAVHSTTQDKNGGSAVGPSAGGFAGAGNSTGAGEQTPTVAGGSAANEEERVSNERGIGRRRPTRPRPVSELVPVAGEGEVYEILDGLGVLGSPAARIPIVRRAVREYLGHNPDSRPTAYSMYPRTPEHAAARIHRKWHRANGPVRSAADYLEPDRIRRPAGYLAQILVEQECETPSCELGVLLDTQQVCGRCESLESARIADAEALRWEADRQAELERRRSETAARRQQAIDAVYDEAAEENERLDRVRAAAATAAARTRLAQERLLAEHTELAAYAQAAEVPGPRTGGEGYAKAAGRGRPAVEEQHVRARLVAEGLRGSALDGAVRTHMAEWKAARRREASAADVTAQAERSIGGRPTTAGQYQAATPPF
ncbi:hypothetical protein [Streptomyces sp. NBC_01205]|uniref:hypothetical protein n=1 Tax=Streptomyces sp. NBC_01205 TaxID=2903771 RepID=UPI002E0DE29F|nr:hypothetical protein OG573_43170 [Streptomyces sp. NBC_01205]